MLWSIGFLQRTFKFMQSFLVFWLCYMACEILVPWPGIKPVPPAVGAWSFNLWTTREVSQWLQLRWASLWNEQPFHKWIERHNDLGVRKLRARLGIYYLTAWPWLCFSDFNGLSCEMRSLLPLPWNPDLAIYFNNSGKKTFRLKGWVWFLLK